MESSTHAQTVRSFTAAFATRDVDTVVGVIHEDFVWETNGQVAGRTRAAFAEQMRADLAGGSVEITIEEVIEDGDVVVALNRGRFVPREGDPIPCVSADVFTFTDGKISRMRTYQPA